MIKFLPKKLDLFLRNLRALKESFKSYLYDYLRFSKYSIKKTFPDDKTQLQSKIISLYHVLEKGLIMPKTRLGYGNERILQLIQLLKIYKTKFNSNSSVHYNSALKVLISYVDIHSKTKIDTTYIQDFLRENSPQNSINGGYYDLDLKLFTEKSKGNFVDLCQIRNSVRNFSDKQVNVVDIKEAIKIAQSSPSTCNRQSSRVYLIEDKSKMEKVLELQSGSRGFADKTDKLLMISYDIKSYQGSGDRNTGYIDSSLFAMTLIYALTFLGIGTVSLNWSKSKELDLKLRQVVSIEKSHNVVFFIGLGHLNKTTKIAVSARPKTEDILICL